eukprot:5601842-Pyramimonas_sp.AAC.2
MALTINLGKDRIYRLLVLICVAGVIGFILQTYLDWSGLTAYGIAVTLAVQVSNAIEKIRNGSGDAEKSKMTKAEARALGVNPKKVSRKNATSKP